MPQRFLIIAWPDDHEESLADHALDIQDFIDEIAMGGAKVIGPLQPETLQAIQQFERTNLP